MNAKLTKDGWLELVPTTQEEFDILHYMANKNGAFHVNGTRYFSGNDSSAKPQLGNATFLYIATAGWTFDKSFIDRMLGK